MPSLTATTTTMMQLLVHKYAMLSQKYAMLSLTMTTTTMQPGVQKYADQDFNHVRNASSSTGQMLSINTVSSIGNEGSNAHYTNQHNVMSGGQSRRYVHREQEYNMRNLLPSREQSPSRKCDYLNMDRNHHDDDSHAGWGTKSSQSSVSSKQMHGPYHSFNQKKYTLPPSYGNLHPYHHPPFNHNASLQALHRSQKQAV